MKRTWINMAWRSIYLGIVSGVKRSSCVVFKASGFHRYVSDLKVTLEDFYSISREMIPHAQACVLTHSAARRAPSIP
jgi:hypothetical protein